MTAHAKHLEKMRKRAACTDFEYFKVRSASRQANKIKGNCLKNLKANHPRALAKMERKKRAKLAEARKARLAKKKAAGKLKEREFVPKEKRNKKTSSTTAEPKLTVVKSFRVERDARRKSASQLRVSHVKELQANRAAIKAAVKAGTKPPHKIRVKKLQPKPSTTKKLIAKRKAKKA